MVACSGRAAAPEQISAGNEPAPGIDSNAAAGSGSSESSTNDSNGRAGNGSTAPSTDGGATSTVPDISASDGPCTAPLELGSTDLGNPHMQLLWTGNDFLVGWEAADEYSLRGIRRGAVSSATLSNPDPAKVIRATMLWVNSELRVYWTYDAVTTREVYDAQFNKLEPSEQISDSVWPSGFAQVNGEVLYAGYNALYVEGVLHDVYWGGPQVMGYNGTDLMGAEVLGHGEWRTSAASGGPPWARLDPPPIDHNWFGASYVHGGGASFASSPETGLHAMAITSGTTLWVAVQGHEPWEGQAIGELPEASFVWDGTRYALFLADGPARYDAEGDGTAKRDLILHFVSPEGQVDAFDQGIAISLAEEDDSAPAAVALGAGRYAVAWKRGGAVMFAECQINGE
jgi:hypothetical protein